MRTITVGGHGDNDRQFEQALDESEDWDTIELLPGEYFSRTFPDTYSIKKNLTIVGRNDNLEAVKLNCAFVIGNKKILTLKNLSLNYPGIHLNTLSIYDQSEVFCDNVSINRTAPDKWNTVYVQNSALSLINSQILTGKKLGLVGLQLENSQVAIVNSVVQLLALKKSDGYLRNSTILFALGLEKQSTLTFLDLTIDALANLKYSDLFVWNKSNFKGHLLHFSKSTPTIDIFNSSFTSDNFDPTPKDITWKFDSNSNVSADGIKPETDGPSDFPKD